MPAFNQRLPAHLQLANRQPVFDYSRPVSEHQPPVSDYAQPVATNAIPVVGNAIPVVAKALPVFKKRLLFSKNSLTVLINWIPCDRNRGPLVAVVTAGDCDGSTFRSNRQTYADLRRIVS